MKKRTQVYTRSGIVLVLTLSCHTNVLATSAGGPHGGGSSIPPVITPPVIPPPPAPPPPAETPPASTAERGSPPSGNAISATTGLPQGATATYVDTQSNAVTQSSAPPPGTAVASTAVRVTGIQGATATVAIKLPGAAAGLRVARLNEAAGTWEIVGVVGANGKFVPPDDGVYVVLK